MDLMHVRRTSSSCDQLMMRIDFCFGPCFGGDAGHPLPYRANGAVKVIISGTRSTRQVHARQFSELQLADP